MQNVFSVAALMALPILFIFACGKDDDTKTTAAATIPFSDVSPILTDHCGGTDCHSDGTSLQVYVDNETNLVARAASVIDRVNTKKNMPPSNASEAQNAMTDAERTTIQSFLSQ